ncbi:MAG: hypothetical protein IJE73_01155 [Muribaculaceae bacterium]|nr:hypothetical protein [Muribaculaceae bacterium]
MKLFEKILDERNIFNSIFCMESYVFDKGLLDTSKPVYLHNEGKVEETIAANDLELYYALADKHNIDLISKVIKCCHQKMEWVLLDKKNLFDIIVYFKIKKYEDNKLDFRPMHTARLIDLICMVSILNCLMFDDDLDKGVRKLSDLSKLLPHNFYGNIPSTNVQYLFHKWQTKYKEYTDEIIEHCRAYQKSHNYLTEVSLDIKNFYPSISPKMLYDYITSKLSKTYEDDKETLGIAVAKLSYFNISKNNIEPWKQYYYPKDTELSCANQYMNYGIPQGLPQSYFFGNLCMIEVKRLLMQDKTFKGDAYFYVDDSVIYIQSELDEDQFKKRIDVLNDGLKEECEKAKNDKSTISNYIDEGYLAFQNKLDYTIKFHEKGKSTFIHIDDADNQYGPIANISRETYMNSDLSYNLDEIDDYVSLKKLEALDKVVSREIGKLVDKQDKAKKEGKNGDVLASKLKLLRRFKKYFLYRNRLLKIREEGEPNLNDFRERFLEKATDPEKFFEQYEEDIFQTEYRLIIQNLRKEEANDFKEKIIEFEKQLLSKCNVNIQGKQDSLFYAKDVETSCIIKTMPQDSYVSLIRWARENFNGLKCIMDSDKQLDKLRGFMSIVKREDKDTETKESINKMQNQGFEEAQFTKFVMKASTEYQRKILNVFYSEIIDVIPSDSLALSKRNARRFKYVELRILAYLRNKNFNLERFEEFVEHINEKDISNQMGIDIGVLEVLNIFIKNVRNPEWVDSLIVTHRLTKGLWYNGSKFLNSYTLHNEEHAVTLITKSLELTNRIDYFALKNVDYYILFLACYLHDISMVIHPDLGRLSSENGKNMTLISDLMSQMQNEVKKFDSIDYTGKKDSRYKDAGNFLIKVFNEVYGYFEALVRDNHAKDSAKFIRERSNSLLNYLEPTLLSFVAKVSESHGYDVMDVYGLKSRAQDDTVSLKYLMILIRLADLLDVANDRVNYHLLKQNLRNLSPTSKFHWISHLVTDKIVLKTDYPTDENAEMGDKPITEKINIELHLNVKQLTVSKNTKKCNGCKLEESEKKDDCLHIRIVGGLDSLDECPEECCTIICRWMMRKHDWLIKELIALNDYLYSVNNSLLKTNINFIIYYRDEIRLDADMFDSVQDFLEE